MRSNKASAKILNTMSRGNKASAKIQVAIPQTSNIDPIVNDLFLYALFARLTFTNNDKVEFRTEYSQDTNTIELQIPPNYLQVFDELTGIHQGPNFKAFINWLIGNLQQQIDDLEDGLEGSLRYDVRQIISLQGIQQARSNLAIGSSPTLVYDGQGRVESILYLDGSVKTITYDIDGQVTRVDHIFEEYTYRKDLTYTDGLLASVSESTI